MRFKRLLVFTSMSVMLSAASVAVADSGDTAAVYKSKCATCHGVDGAGQTAMGKSMKLRDLRSPEVQKQSDAELIKITADGKGKMPAYKSKLTEAEIKSLVAHIRSLKK